LRANCVAFRLVTITLFVTVEFVLEKRFARRPANRVRIIYLDLHVQNQLFENLHTHGKIQVHMKHHPSLGKKGKKQAQIGKTSANEAT